MSTARNVTVSGLMDKEAKCDHLNRSWWFFGETETLFETATGGQIYASQSTHYPQEITVSKDNDIHRLIWAEDEPLITYCIFTLNQFHCQLEKVNLNAIRMKTAGPINPELKTKGHLAKAKNYHYGRGLEIGAIMIIIDRLVKLASFVQYLRFMMLLSLVKQHR